MTTEKGTLIIISGPSGSGKGTIVNELIHNKSYTLSISVTTRKPREYEEEGVHYFFKSKEDFFSLIEENKFLEWAEFVGNYYGTPRDYVEKMLEKGKNVILEIEVEGALQVKETFPDCVLIFVVPPSIKELRRRLAGRGTETTQSIQKRIDRAKIEMNLINRYDYIVVNDSIFKSVESINNIVRVEPLKIGKNSGVIDRIKGEILNA